MPKVKETLKMFYRRMVSEYPGVLRADATNLYCTICDKPLYTKKIFGVKQHFGSAGHVTFLQEAGLVADDESLMFMSAGFKQR